MDALPWWMGLTLCAVFIMLLLFTRSLLVAFTAAVLGALSIGAALGLMVLLFQRLQLLGPPATGGASTLEITMPLLAAALAFGLCVDYEVFLVSRMAEEWRRTGHNTAAIVFGIEHTGRLFTTAALVVAVSMGALMLSQVSLLVALGTTLAAIVLIDATVVRGVLVPAFRQLAGRVNWWSPPTPGRAAPTTAPAPAPKHRTGDHGLRRCVGHGGAREETSGGEHPPRQPVQQIMPDGRGRPSTPRWFGRASSVTDSHSVNRSEKPVQTA
ncbi:MMPL family transporter [Streptomyces tauricus]|uniref:MMPL family transporter n=1 Tax=Streptomyces tauricus TaxID=68274 RepID=UPI0033F6DFA4